MPLLYFTHLNKKQKKILLYKVLCKSCNEVNKFLNSEHYSSTLLLSGVYIILLDKHLKKGPYSAEISLQ